MVDEPAGEVAAVQERAIADEQADVGFEWVESDGAGPEEEIYSSLAYCQRPRGWRHFQISPAEVSLAAQFLR